MSSPETNGEKEAVAAEKVTPGWLEWASIVPALGIGYLLTAYIPRDMWKVRVVVSGHSEPAVAVGVLWMLGSLLLLFVVWPFAIQAVSRWHTSGRALKDYPRYYMRLLALGVVLWFVGVWMFGVAWRVEIIRKPESVTSYLQTP